MKRVFTLFLAVLMLLTSLLTLAACGEMEDDGAVINAYYVGEMYDFDPARAIVDDDAMRVMSLLYEPLFTLDEKGRVKKALAQDYETSYDEATGKYTMEITIKPTMWSNGTLVKADDVVYAWQRILEPDFKSQAAPLLYAIENALEAKTAAYDENGKPIGTMDIGAEAVATDKIAITFRTVTDEEGKPVTDKDGKPVEPDYDAFLRNLTSLALAPVCRTEVSKAEDYWGKRAITIVTSGPFTISTLAYDTGEFTIERNRYYDYALKEEAMAENPDENVRPYQIITSWVTDWGFAADWDYEAEPEKFADFIAEHSLFIMSDLPLSVREAAKDDMEVADNLSTMSILLNTVDRSATRKTALGNAAIRRALSSVIDREEIAKILVYARPATGLISSGVFNADSRRDDFREEGGALISTTGVAKADLPAEFNEAFAGLSTKQKRLTLAFNDTEADRAVAEYVKGKWEELGFTVTLRALSYIEDEVILDLGGANTQSLKYRSSELIDVYQDFTVGDGHRVLTDYVTPGKSLFNNDAELDKLVFDALIVDYQMLAPEAFTTLAGFSTNLNGNGLNFSKDADGYRDYTPLKHMTGYASAEYDALIAQAYNETDPDKRAELLHDAEELLLADMPVIPLTFGQTHYYLAKGIKKVDIGYYGYPIFTRTKLKNYQKYLPTEDLGEDTTEAE